MTHTTLICYLCETAEATAMKTEIELVQIDDEDCTDIQVPTTRPICLPCNERWFDGTEEVPALLPLS